MCIRDRVGREWMEGPGDYKYCFKQWPLVLRQYLRCYVEPSPRYRPWVPKSLTFKSRVRVKPFFWKWVFFFMRIKSFLINSFAFTLDLPSSRVLDNSEILTEERIWPTKMSLLENSPSRQSNKKRIIKELQKKKDKKRPMGKRSRC